MIEANADSPRHTQPNQTASKKKRPARERRSNTKSDKAAAIDTIEGPALPVKRTKQSAEKIASIEVLVDASSPIQHLAVEPEKSTSPEDQKDRKEAPLNLKQAVSAEKLKPMSAAKSNSQLLSSIKKNSEFDLEIGRKCNCKQGQCRQLYCVCLKQGLPCRPGICQCDGCQNDEREDAAKAREEQKQKIESDVRRGCNCKKNYCKKNYCICHNGGKLCDPKLCNCTDCYNVEGAPPVPKKNATPKVQRTSASK